MNKNLPLAAILCAILSFSVVKAESINLKPYQNGDWSTIVKSANGQPLAVHIWGVTCAPCVKEMPKWGKYLAKHKDDKVIFMQVDDVSVGMMEKMLLKANLGEADNYYVSTAFDERLRYEIDPKWRGETPITLLIDRTGKSERQVGPVDFSKLQTWFHKP